MDTLFGDTASAAGFTDNYVYVDGISVPAGRAAANGQTLVLITALLGYCSGNGAARNVVLTLGSAQSASFGVAAAASAQSTGWQACNWLTLGGSFQFNIDMDGSAYFARGGGGTSYDSYGTAYAGTLGGGFRWAQCPVAAAAPVLTAGPGQITMTWQYPADDGGSGVTTWVMQYADNPSFTGATQVDPGNSGTYTWSVAPGKTYYVRVASNNAVTTAGNTTSPWSAASSVFVGIGGKRFDGTSWVPFTTAKRFDGTSWVDIQTAKRFDGTSWVNLT